MRRTTGVIGLFLLATIGCASQMQMGGVNTAISGSAGGGGSDSTSSAGPKCPTPIGPAALVEPDARGDDGSDPSRAPIACSPCFDWR